MTYWSSENIPAIEVKSTGLDTIVRLHQKSYSSVGAYTVTATSYALLTYMANSEPKEDLDAIQKFLQEQRLTVGAFYSTMVWLWFNNNIDCRASTSKISQQKLNLGV